MNFKKLAMVGCGIAGGAAAVASGAGVLMVGAVAIASAGAPPVLSTIAKIASKQKLDKEDALTITAVGAGLALTTVVLPNVVDDKIYTKEMREDPTTHLVAAFGAPAFLNALYTLATGTAATRDTATDAVKHTQRRFNH